MKNKIQLLIIGCVIILLFTGVLSLSIWFWMLSANIIGLLSFAAIISFLIAFSFLLILLYRRSCTSIKQNIQNELRKNKLCCSLLSSWMINKMKGKMIQDYFKDHDLKTIAIYGLDKLGMCLLAELQESEIKVSYAIDPNSEHYSYLDITVNKPDMDLESVDAIIVTNVEQFDKISLELQNKGISNVISLEDIIGSF